MGRLMHDALGVGLAATQLGILHRVLVYQAYADDPVSVLVNPEIEWRSDELELAEEGCLSLPSVHVEVERNAAIRVRALDAAAGDRSGRRGSRGAGHPARDRPPRRGPDPRSHPQGGPQGGDARDARVPEDPQRRLGPRFERRLPRHLGLRRRGARAARGLPSPPALAGDHAARPAERARTAPVQPARRRRGQAPGADPRPAPAGQRARGGRRDHHRRGRRAGARGARRLRVRRVDRRAAALSSADPERAPLAAPALARCRAVERAIMAGDEQTGVSIMRLTAGLDEGPVCLSAAEAITPGDTYGRWPGASRISAPPCSSGPSRSRRPSSSRAARRRTRRRSPPPTAPWTRDARPSSSPVS